MCNIADLQSCCSSPTYRSTCVTSYQFKFDIRDCLFQTDQQIAFTILDVFYIALAIYALINVIKITLLRLRTNMPILKLLMINVCIFIYAVAKSVYAFDGPLQLFFSQELNIAVMAVIEINDPFLFEVAIIIACYCWGKLFISRRYEDMDERDIYHQRWKYFFFADLACTVGFMIFGNISLTTSFVDGFQVISIAGFILTLINGSLFSFCCLYMAKHLASLYHLDKSHKMKNLKLYIAAIGFFILLRIAEAIMHTAQESLIDQLKFYSTCNHTNVWAYYSLGGLTLIDVLPCFLIINLFSPAIKPKSDLAKPSPTHSGVSLKFLADGGDQGSFFSLQATAPLTGDQN